jgi:two-component system capsular synthesis sensor histidine kinase RcsC
MKIATDLEGKDFPALGRRQWLPLDVQSAPCVQDSRDLRRILVVDDDKGVRDVMAGIFGDLGYHVTVAADGAEAVILFQDSTFGLVLTDLNMPGMDGWSLAEQIRKESSVPIVLITASHRGSVEARLKGSSVDSVLYKPFRVEELLSLVIKAFSTHT